MEVYRKWNKNEMVRKGVSVIIDFVDENGTWSNFGVLRAYKDI